MDIERNTDVLYRELSVITRILTRIAIALSLICGAIYASPDQAAEVRVMTTGIGIHP